jgi:hypothetical protein
LSGLKCCFLQKQGDFESGEDLGSAVSEKVRQRGLAAIRQAHDHGRSGCRRKPHCKEQKVVFFFNSYFFFIKTEVNHFGGTMLCLFLTFICFFKKGGESFYALFLFVLLVFV